MKMHKNFRAFGALFLLLALLISAFCVTASAVPPIDDGVNGVQWIYINADHTKLDGDGVTYEKVDLPADCHLMETVKRYVYMNSPRGYATGSEETGETVYSYEKGGYLIYVTDRYYDATTIFCREDMLSALQNYFKGTEGQYVLRTAWLESGQFNGNDKYSYVPESLADELMSLSKNAKGVKTDVSVLKNCDIRELRLQDKSGLLTTVKGAVYAMPDGSFGFVDYTTLDNSHFDAEGNFSYRQGEVMVYTLSDDLGEQVNAWLGDSYYLDGGNVYEYYEYEADIGIIGGTNYTDESAIVAFWVIFVLVGYLLPIAPLVIGLVFAHSKKMSHPRRWYVVVGLAVLWILLAVGLTVLLLV